MHGHEKSTPFGLALPDVPHPKGSVLLLIIIITILVLLIIMIRR